MAAPTVPTVDTLNVQTGREESKKMPWTPKAPIVPIISKKIDRPGKESEGQRNVKSVLRDLAIWSQIDPQCFMQYDNISENLMLMGPEVRLTDMASTITQNFGDYFTIYCTGIMRFLSMLPKQGLLKHAWLWKLRH